MTSKPAAHRDDVGLQLGVAALPRSLQGRMGARAMNKFLRSMQQESDRGLVIGIISVLDDLMAERLKLVFKHGTPRAQEAVQRALQTFNNRINAMHALGLINDETAKDLHALREYRNKVAHEWAAFTFTPEVEKKFVDPLFRDRATLVDRDGAPIVFSARLKMMWVALVLIIALHQTKVRKPARQPVLTAPPQPLPAG